MEKKQRGKRIELKENVQLIRRCQIEWKNKEENNFLQKGRVQWSGPPCPKPPPSWVRGRPVFNEPSAAPKNLARPDLYHEPPIITPELEACLVIGGSVIAKFDMQVGYKGVYPFLPLERYDGKSKSTAAVPAGSLLVYAGTVRCTEAMFYAEQHKHKKYANVEVLKHTFITPSFGRCIIHDFSLIAPA
jgi:hypothetical protein